MLKNNNDISLKKEDINVIMDMARTLGESDIEGQKSILLLTINNIQKQIKEAEWPLFDADTPLEDRWMIIASGYNQGQSYAINAMKQLKGLGREITWDSVLDWMTTYPLPAGYPKAGKRPYTNAAETYGPYAVNGLIESDLVTAAGIGVGVIAVAAVGGYLLYKSMMKPASI